MEDAAKALEMAAAVLIFIIALSVSFMLIGQAKQTSDAVFAATDKTLYYEYVEENAPNAEVTRVVGIETIIPTLYRYNDENLRIVIIYNGEIIQVVDTSLENLFVRYSKITILEALNSKSIYQNLSKVYYGNDYTYLPELKTINDLLRNKLKSDEDLLRAYANIYSSNAKQNQDYGNNLAYWAGNKQNIKKYLEMVINGNNIKIEGRYDYECSTKSIMDCKNTKFNERFIKYKISGEDYVVDGEVLELVAGNEKTVIIYEAI